MRGHLVEEVRCPWQHVAAVVDWLHSWPGGASYEARQEDATGGPLAVFTLEPECARAARAALAVDWLPATTPRLPWAVLERRQRGARTSEHRGALLATVRTVRSLSLAAVQRLTGLCAQTVADLESGALDLATEAQWRALYALVRSVDRPAAQPGEAVRP